MKTKHLKEPRNPAAFRAILHNGYRSDNGGNIERSLPRVP